MAPLGRTTTYPTNHLLAVLDDPAAADRAAADLDAAGFAPADVSVLRGEAADDAIAGLGARHGLLSRLIRAVQFMTMDQMPDFGRYALALQHGRTVVAVHVVPRERMLLARTILVGRGAHFLNYYGRVATEELGRWRDPDATWIDQPYAGYEAQRRRGGRR